jgi:hypothetical protein
MKRIGCKFWALDYREFVTVLSIERRGRYTIQRVNGSRTFNYPSYLLKKKKPEAFC